MTSTAVPATAAPAKRARSEDLYKNQNSHHVRVKLSMALRPDLQRCIDVPATGKTELSLLQKEYACAVPYPYLRIKNFADEDGKFLRGVAPELQNLDFNIKSNDLYHFFQTAKDLKSCHPGGEHGMPRLCAVRDFLYSEKFVSFIEKVTGVGRLDRTNIDVSAAIYRQGSYLLCHDDRLKSRKVAFILYLVDKDWCVSDGGCLDLFDSDSNDDPRGIVSRVAPLWNSFLFFEVTKQSHHQVAEVLAGDKVRLTISGWYHAPQTDTKATAECSDHDDDEEEEEEDHDEDGDEDEDDTTSLTPEEMSLVDRIRLHPGVATHINPRYLDPGVILKLKKQFESSSSIELREFLKPTSYSQLRNGFKHPSLTQLCGPPQKKRYNVVDSKVIGDILSLLRSDAFASVLRVWTQYMVKCVSGEARSFEKGHYTLCHDGDERKPKRLLEATLCCVEDESAWHDAGCGYVCYLDDSEELLSIFPAPNTFSLVLRDFGCSKFVKYIQARAPGPRHDIDLAFELEED